MIALNDLYKSLNDRNIVFHIHSYTILLGFELHHSTEPSNIIYINHIGLLHAVITLGQEQNGRHFADLI